MMGKADGSLECYIEKEKGKNAVVILSNADAAITVLRFTMMKTHLRLMV